MITLQFTLVDKTGKNRPVSCLINVRDLDYFNENKESVKREAVLKICRKRGWTGKEIREKNYTSFKVRIFDKEAYEKERIEKLKKRLDKSKEKSYNKDTKEKKGDTK